jgi:hypothetical protein
MPTPETATIDHATLAGRVAAGTIRNARIIGQAGGWGIIVKDGRTARTLAARRGSARLFRRFETLVGYLKQIGLDRYEVDASGYAPEIPTRRRPDSAKRLARAHAAAGHDRWFRAQVEGTIEGIRRGRVAVITSEEHDARWRRKRAELRARERRGR